MARVKGPLYSEHASGKFGQNLSFRTSKGRSYAMTPHRRAGNTKNLASQHARVYEFLIWFWQQITQHPASFRFARVVISKTLFLCAPPGQSGYQYWIKSVIPDVFRLTTFNQLNAWLYEVYNGNFTGTVSFALANTIVRNNRPYLLYPRRDRLSDEHYLVIASYIVMTLAREFELPDRDNELFYFTYTLIRQNNNGLIVRAQQDCIVRQSDEFVLLAGPY